MKLFIDMDGTVAKFYESASCLEEMYSPGFFKKLNPYVNVIKGIITMIRTAKQNERSLEVYVLSSVPGEIYEQIVNDKTCWLNKNLTIVPASNYIFTEIGESKAEKIKDMFGDIGEDFYLLDDYNKNLKEWTAEGGTAIKVVNEINDKGTNGPLWKGHRIRYDYAHSRICDELMEIMNL